MSSNFDYEQLLSALPHQGEMKMIHQITDLGSNSITCQVFPQNVLGSSGEAHHPLCSSIGIEYMAQAAGCLLAAINRGAHHSGMLVSVRKFSSEVSTFLPDISLSVSAEILASGDENALFHCLIRKDPGEQVIQSGQIGIVFS